MPSRRAIRKNAQIAGGQPARAGALWLAAPLAAAAWLACSFAVVGEETPPAPPRRQRVEVNESRPHDSTAFTQGLLIEKGILYESAGNYGQSSLREVNLETGEVARRLNLAPAYFAEGLAWAGGRLIQLTWREQAALIYDPATFQQTGEFRYTGEGWGLTFDGQRLIMSDGSSRLFFRDPKTFDLLTSVTVTLDGAPRPYLNELEFANGYIYANVWRLDDILQIDPATGRVVAVIDASGLLTAEERRRADVLNGIAWDPERRTFLLTGKYWPRMFEVRFIPADPRPV